MGTSVFKSFANFITALQQIIPELQIDLPGMLHGVQPAASATLMSVLINEMAELLHLDRVRVHPPYFAAAFASW